MPPVSELLAGFPVVIEVDVAWGEMDAFQHVNNTVYFRWFESARIAYFRRVGFVPESVGSPRGVGPILATADCRFRIPLTYPDRVSIGARARDLEAEAFMMEYAVVSRAAGALAASGTSRIVSYDYGARSKAPLPEDVRRQIQRLERESAA
jgi:acyl-CoA thioester hydrolase